MPTLLPIHNKFKYASLWLAVTICLAVVPSGFSAKNDPAPDSKSSVQLVFDGNKALSEAGLRKAAQQEFEDLNRYGGRESDLDDAAYQMEAVYRKSGFPFATVDYRLEKNQSGPRATFTISEGPKVMLAEIRFKGISVSEEKELLPLFEKSQNGLLKTDKPVYVEADIEDAVDQIRNIFRSRGYLDVVVAKPDIQFSDANSRATVTLPIQKNQQYVIREIRFTGDVIEAAQEELSGVKTDLAGQPYFPRQKFALQKRVHQIYGSLGYPDVLVSINETSAGQKTDVIFDTSITSGPQVTIATIQIEGNERTRDQFIISRLHLKPGDTFSLDKKQSSFRALYRTGLFSTVDISLSGAPNAEQRTLVVAVIEAAAKEVYVEPGWGSYERLRLKFGFREANLFGTGRIFEATTRLSLLAQGVGVSVTDPWFLNTDITAQIPVNYEHRVEPSFTREDLTAAFLLTKELSENVTVTGGYTLQRTSLTEVDVDVVDFDQDENYNLTSLKAQVSYDTRNDIFFPTKGLKSFLSVEYADELFGGNISFARLAGGLRYFFKLRQSTVLAMRYSTGLIIPGPDQIGIPLGERFFTGGENTVRSFEEGQLGPKDGSNEPTGGLAYNIISIELRQQIVNRLMASLFLDLGNIAPNRSREELGKAPYDSRTEIWQDTLDDYFSDFRPAVGVGLQYLLPFGPARLDLAFNPDRDKERDEDLYVWHFSIGMAF